MKAVLSVLFLVLFVSNAVAQLKKAEPTPTPPPLPPMSETFERAAGCVLSYSAETQLSCATVVQNNVKKDICWGAFDNLKDPGKAANDRIYRDLQGGKGVPSQITYCAISDAPPDQNKVYCWGKLAQPPTPDHLRFRSICVGGIFQCGITVDKLLHCWAWPETMKKIGTEMPIIKQVSVLTTTVYTNVSCGYQHACATRTDGRIVCWSQLGKSDGSVLVPHSNIERVGYVSEDADYESISTGHYHTCAIRKGGHLSCWGWNGFHQCNVPEDTYLSVSAGFDHTCALTTSKKMRCWGRNDNGQVAIPKLCLDGNEVQETNATVVATPAPECKCTKDGCICPGPPKTVFNFLQQAHASRSLSSLAVTLSMLAICLSGLL